MKKFFILLFFIGLAGLWGQEGFQPANNASAYSYSGTITGAEQLKIYTYIWGQVNKPGLYIVPDNTDLLALISLAGGPTETAKLSEIRIIRPTANGEKVFTVNIKDYMENGDEKIIPVLQPGDTVIVSGTVFYAFSKVVKFFSEIAVILSVFVAIHTINSND